MAEDSIRDKKVIFWEAFWPALQSTTSETENHIDRKIYGISVGGIGAGIACLQFISDPTWIVLAAISGFSFVATLLLNLYAQVKSLKSQQKERESIKGYLEDNNAIEDSFIYDLIEDENRKILNINKLSIVSMSVALISLLVFVIHNIPVSK